MRHPRPFLLCALAALAAACSDAGTPPAPAGRAAAPLLAAAPGQGIPDQYIVVVKEGTDPRSVAAVAGAAPRHVYTAAINGFSANLNQGQLNALRHHPGVELVEQDQAATHFAVQSSAPWNLDRIDQRVLPLSGTYGYTTTASSVNAYVIDTGIAPTHPGFGGRAQVAYDATGGNGIDCHGHGTHVAGVIGSGTYGVAKGVRLWGVRVLGCTGAGTSAQIIAGIDWVRLNARKPAVANLSVGSAFSTALNTAATNLASSGVFVSVGAGNSNVDACTVSPASAPAVFTTAASDRFDARVPSSNYGPCVDAYAPGSAITSTWPGTGTSALSSTSVAAAHVAGIAALYKGTFGDASTATVTTWIKNNAIPNVITGNPANTPNLLVNKATL